MRKISIILGLFVFMVCNGFIQVPEESLVESFDSQFTKIHDGKYYVKPGSIHVTSEDIFFCCNGCLIPVTSIERDAEGVFIRPEALQVERCVCGWPLVWGFCINDNCPTKS